MPSATWETQWILVSMSCWSPDFSGLNCPLTATSAGIHGLTGSHVSLAAEPL
jgi:hypothetical protein